MPPNPLAPSSSAAAAAASQQQAALLAQANSNAQKAQLSETKVFSHTSGAVTAETSVVEFAKSYHSTGICFLDHMVDQLTSHGQLGVTMKVSVAGPDGNTIYHQPHVDYAGGSLTESDRLHDEDIFKACGASLGMALRDLVKTRTNGSSDSASATFLCPLDEALAEVLLELSTTAAADPSNVEHHCKLAPYGNMPPNVGRRWIGCYRCNLTPTFFDSLQKQLGCQTLRLCKIRGHNAHHIVESTFKAFARVFRACLDEMTMGGKHGCVVSDEDRLAARRQQALRDSMETESNDGSRNKQKKQQRTGSRSRTTKETTIEVNVDLDRFAPQNTEPSSIYTGVELTDKILEEIRTRAGFHFDVHCDGDIYIDDHHTSEDVAITLGQCLNQALGDKAGLARMGCATAQYGTAKIRCTMDLSNRPYFEWNLPLDQEYVGGDEEAFGAMKRGASARNAKFGGDATMLCGSALTCEMLQHVFESLTIETRATVHLELVSHDLTCEGRTKDLALAAARAFGTALAECVRVDPRRAGKVASSKGTLSV